MSSVKEDEKTADGSEEKDVEEVPQTFPQKLMEILSDEANTEIIAWLPHGKGFQIINKKRFAAEILPKHFSRKSKYTSFTRKLNRWNYTRVTRGPETGAYYHPLFQRDDPRLCMQMQCIHSKTPQQMQPMNPIALGLGYPNNFAAWYPDPNDPQAMARMEEQRQQYMQFFAQQQHQGDEEHGEKKAAPVMDEAAMMAYRQQWMMQQAMMQQPQQQNQEEGDKKSEEQGDKKKRGRKEAAKEGGEKDLDPKETDI